jgi:hypothetical protein
MIFLLAQNASRVLRRIQSDAAATACGKNVLGLYSKNFQYKCSAAGEVLSITAPAAGRNPDGNSKRKDCAEQKARLDRPILKRGGGGRALTRVEVLSSIVSGAMERRREWPTN